MLGKNRQLRIRFEIICYNFINNLKNNYSNYIRFWLLGVTIIVIILILILLLMPLIRCAYVYDPTIKMIETKARHSPPTSIYLYACLPMVQKAKKTIRVINNPNCAQGYCMYSMSGFLFSIQPSRSSASFYLVWNTFC